MHYRNFLKFLLPVLLLAVVFGVIFGCSLLDNAGECGIVITTNYIEDNKSYGTFQYLGDYSLSFESPKALIVSTDNQYVYLLDRGSASSDASIIVMERNKSAGTLSTVSGITNNTDVTDMPAPYQFVISSDGLYVYVVDNVKNKLFVFDRNSNTGALIYKAVYEDGNVDGSGNTTDGLNYPTDVL